MNLLVLGGTLFLGRHVVEAALAQGHEVTLFNRGQRNPGLFPSAKRLIGDRDGDMSALHGHLFDAVIDCSGYTPAQMHRTLAALGPTPPHYVFISTISVMASFPPGAPFDEDGPTATGDEGYGPLKARSEEVLQAALGDGLAVVRPGLIVGPFDPTGRFAYWPWRIAQGGAVLAPGNPQRLVQFIDARDLAAWCVQLAQRRTAGTFNAVCPPQPMAELLQACTQACNAKPRLHWLPDETVQALDIAPWSGLPLWIPHADPTHGGMLNANPARALTAGLVYRPWGDTVRDTWAWLQTDATAVACNPNALSLAREAECLALQAPGASNLQPG